MLKALLRTRDLYSRWRAVEEGKEIRSHEEQEWAATELRNALRSIEWDLEDLEDTVQIVERNPTKFRISAAELQLRKAFIAQTRQDAIYTGNNVSFRTFIKTSFREEVAGMKATAAGQTHTEDVSHTHVLVP